MTDLDRPSSPGNIRSWQFKYQMSSRKIKQIQKQLELSQKTVKKLRKDKKKISKEIDRLRGEKGKLQSQLHWKNLEFNRRQKELETSKRHELWKLKRGYIKSRNNLKPILIVNDNDNDNDDDNDDNKQQQVLIDDPEIKQIFNAVYNIENKIAQSLQQFDDKNSKFNKAKDYLDNSFDTISLLLQESKAQKAIIRELNIKIKVLLQQQMHNNPDNNIADINDDNSHLLYKNQLNQLKTELINKNQIIQQLMDKQHQSKLSDINIQNDAHLYNVDVDNMFKKQIKLLQQQNMEYQSDLHSKELEIEQLKHKISGKNGKIESDAYQIENYQTLMQSNTEQIKLIEKQMSLIKTERDELRKTVDRIIRNKKTIQQLPQTTGCCSGSSRKK